MAIEYTIAVNEYYQGFVESTSMKPSEGICELEQNVKETPEGDTKLCVSLYDKDMVKMDQDKKSKNDDITFHECAYITVEDNSIAPMTAQNARDMMMSLKKTTKNGGPGCFNFGEILAMNTLTGGNGKVIYYNKMEKESWVLYLPKGGCPSLSFELASHETGFLERYMEDSFSQNGTLKIICIREPYDFQYNRSEYMELSNFIDIEVNGISYPRYNRCKHFDYLLKSPEYKYKYRATYYVEVTGTEETKVNLTRCVGNQYCRVDNVAQNGRPKSVLKSFKECDKSVGKRRKKGSNFKVTVDTLIVPHDYYGNMKDSQKIYYNVSGFNFPVRDVPDILKTVYPNNGGNKCLQNTRTCITVSCVPGSNDNTNTWIKKNVFNFYPDKLKTGQPLTGWKYLRNYILTDLENYYTEITSDTFTGQVKCFAVRNTFVPDSASVMFKYDTVSKEYTRVIKPNEEDDTSSSDSEDDYELEIVGNGGQEDQQNEPPEHTTELLSKEVLSAFERSVKEILGELVDDDREKARHTLTEVIEKLS